MPDSYLGLSKYLAFKRSGIYLVIFIDSQMLPLLSRRQPVPSLVLSYVAFRFSIED